MLKRNAPTSEVVSRLTSWTLVCAATALGNRIFDPVCGFWVPFYYPAKVITIAWLAFPETGAADFLFSKYVEPWCIAFEDELTGFIARIRMRQDHSVLNLRRLRCWTSQSLKTRSREESVTVT
jgi:TB2/DP1, HVA22 family